MSYDTAGDTNFSINQSTITGKPPFVGTNCIAYNGKYWIACGNEVVNTKTISTYSNTNSLEILAYQSDDYLNEAISNKFYWEDQLVKNPGNQTIINFLTNNNNAIARYTTEKAAYNSQALATYNTNKSLFYIPTGFTRKFVHTLAISTNGYNWTYIENNPFSVSKLFNQSYDEVTAKANAVAWNGTKWLVVGKGKKGFEPDGDERTSYKKNYAASSTDGTNWTICGSTFTSELFCVACSSTKWIVGGGALYSSSDLVTWTETANDFNTTFTKYYGIAYNGSLWVAVGTQMSTACIITSSNGTSWNQRLAFYDNTSNNEKNRTFKAVAYNGSSWIAVGETIGMNQTTNLNQKEGIIAKSSDGIAWTIQTGFTQGLNSISWNGNEWIIGGLFSNLYISTDGTNWSQPIENSNNVQAVCTKIVLPVLGGTINTVSSLYVGFGNPASVMRSYDNQTWIPQLLNGEGKNYIVTDQKEFYGGIWTGTYWIIVGEPQGNAGRNIAVSENGIDWLYPRNTLGGGRGIATNGSLIIAVGEGVNANMRISTSTDALIWTSVNCTLLKNCKCVAWNGTYWVIGGIGGIITSTNGATWTSAVVCPLDNVYSLSWNGYYWVAVGSGVDHCVALSVDSQRWYVADTTVIPFTESGNSVFWNKSKYIAVGKGKNTIAISDDGYTWTERGSLVIKYSGTSIAWDGSKWLASGYSNHPVVSSPDGDTWTVYEVDFTRGNCFINKTVSLPYTGTSSSTVLQKVNAVVARLTNSTNDTLAFEQEQLKLQQDAIAAAAALAARNDSKSESSAYYDTVSNWKTTINAQFTPLTVTTYGNLSKLYPELYLIATGFNDYVGLVLDNLLSLKNRVYDDTNTQTELDDTVELMLDYVNKVDSGFVTFYDTIRQLYSNLTTLTFDSVTDNDFTDIINGYGYSNTRKTQVLNFYNTKLNAFTTLKNTAISNYSTSITTINNTSLPNTKSYYANLIYYDTNTLFDSGYSTNDSNPLYFLTLLPTVYSKINVYKEQAEAYIQQAKDDAADWATVLNTTPTSTQTIDDAFKVLFDELYNPVSLSTSFLPYNTQQQAALLLSDYPVRKYRVLAESYKHPYSYPDEIQELHDELQTAINDITTTSNDAITYTTTELDTTIKNKLADIKNITKTDYTLTLTTKTHLNTLLTKMYYSNSDYKDAVNYLKFLKSAYILYPTLKQKILDVYNADLAAEADGATPPATGWGGVVNLQGNITNVTYLSDFRVKITTTSNISKLAIAYGIFFYKLGNPIVHYRNDKRYLVDEIGDGYFVINAKETILNDVTATDYKWNFQLQGKDLGKQGNTQGWTVFNETYYARERLQSYIQTNGVNYGTWYTFKNPGVLLGEGVPWKEFLTFTNTVTYTEIRNKIDNLNTKIDEINDSEGFTEAYIDSLVSADVNAIQSKYKEYAEAYIDSLTVGVSTLLPDEDILDQFGDKVVTGTDTLQDVVDQINADYDYLVNQLASIDLTGKTNSEIQTIVNNAINTKNALTAVTYGNTYKSFLANARTYITNYTSAYNFINDTLKESVDRWVDNIKPKALLNAPFDIAPISDGTGEPFIMSILPTDTDYWLEVTRNEFKILSTGVVTRTLPSALSATNFKTYASNTDYVVGDMVKNSSNQIFRCIKDNSPEDGVNAFEGIKGVLPIISTTWKIRKYPYVFNAGNYQIEGSPENLSKLNPNNYLKYDSTTKYKKEDYVYYDGYVYRCIDVINSTNTFKGIPPTNTSYWETVTYPSVVYNGKVVEASPSNIPALNASSIATYGSNTLYRDGDYVKHSGTFIDPATNTTYTGTTILQLVIDEYSTTVKGIPPWYGYSNTTIYNSGVWETTQFAHQYIYSNTATYKLGDIVQFNSTNYKLISTYARGTAPTVGSRGYAPVITVEGTDILQSLNWKVRTYPTVVYNFEKIEGSPTNIPAYNPATVTAYSNNTSYNNGDIVSYQNAVYKCAVKYPGSLYNVPVSNTNFWQQVNYPIINYLGKEIEAVPGIIKPLSTSDFSNYDNTKVYYIGDLVVYDSTIFECIGDLTTNIPIRNIPPTSTTYWRRFIYPLVQLSHNNLVLEADPSLPEFEVLDEKDFHIYDNNWLYNKGDKVSYDGKVYECINCVPPSRVNGATPNITPITNISPTNTSYWEAYTIDYVPLSISQWDIRINYAQNTKILYNGYFYNCETSHTSSTNNNPESSIYHWRRIADLTDIGLPQFYDSSANYSEGDKVTLRTTQDSTYVAIHYTCTKTDPNEPVLYAYDKYVILATKDSDGKPIIGRIPGTWNKNNLRRYGTSAEDPFRIEGFCGKLRRRVAMEVEMPYNNAYEIIRYNPTRYPIEKAFPNVYYAVLKPTNHNTRMTTLQTTITNAFNKFTTSETDISIRSVYSDIYSILIYQANKRNEKVTELNQLVNDMKMSHFNCTSTQLQINADPYSFMNPIAFAQDPPQKLFKDLGVGNLEEIEYDVFIEKSGKYTQSDYDLCKENTEKMNSLLEQASILTFEIKLMIGYGLYHLTSVSKDKAGGAISCDSGTIYLPIGDYQAYEYFVAGSAYPTDGLMYSIEQLISNSVKPPEYTLPNSQATADLQVLTYEAKSPFLTEFLLPFAKGFAGIAVSLFTGSGDIVGGLLGLVGTISLAASNAINNEDENTNALTATTQMKGIQFNTLDESIDQFLTAVGNYKDIQDEEEVQEKIGDLINFLGVCLELYKISKADIEEVRQWDFEERSHRFSLQQVDTTQVILPDEPAKPRLPTKRTPIYKGPSEDLIKSLKAEQARLEDTIDKIKSKIDAILELEPEVPVKSIKSVPDSYRQRVVVASGVEISPGKPKVITETYVKGTFEWNTQELTKLKTQRTVLYRFPEANKDAIREINKKIFPLEETLKGQSLDPKYTRGSKMVNTQEAIDPVVQQTKKVKKTPLEELAQHQIDRSRYEAEKAKLAETKARNNFKTQQRGELNSQLTDTQTRSDTLKQQISELEAEKLNAELELDEQVKTANKEYQQALEKYNQDLADFNDAHAKREVLREYKNKLQVQNTRTRVNNAAKINELNALINIENVNITRIESLVIDGKLNVNVKYDILVEKITKSVPFKTRLFAMLPESVRTSYATLELAYTDILDKTKLNVTNSVKAWRTYAYELSNVHTNKFSFKWFILEGGVFRIFKRPGLAAITGLVEIVGKETYRSVKKLGGGSFIAGVGKLLEVYGAIMGAAEAGAFTKSRTLGV